MSQQRQFRVLLIEPKGLYHNPTQRRFAECLDSAFDVVRYGPGHVAHERIEERLDRILATVGRIDAVFISRFFIFKNLKAAANSMFCAFDAERFLRERPNFVYGFDRASCPVFGILIGTDGYSLAPERLAVLEAFPGYFIGNKSDTIRLHTDLPNLDEEEFLRAGYNDNYASFVARNDRRIVPVGHILGMDEFVTRPVERRRYVISVPGEAYEGRRRAVEILREAGYDVGTVPPLQARVRWLVRLLGIDLKRSQLGIWFYNWSFRQLLADSRMCFTEGSKLQRPLRKYLEIPAASSLLLCHSNVGIEKRGFRDGIHYLEARPEDLPRLTRWVLRNEAAASRIMRQGFDLVRRKHTVPARSRQLGLVLQKVLDGSFRGVSFEDGEFSFD